MAWRQHFWHARTHASKHAHTHNIRVFPSEGPKSGFSPPLLFGRRGRKVGLRKIVALLTSPTCGGGGSVGCLIRVVCLFLVKSNESMQEEKERNFTMSFGGFLMGSINTFPFQRLRHLQGHQPCRIHLAVMPTTTAELRPLHCNDALSACASHHDE